MRALLRTSALGVLTVALATPAVAGTTASDRHGVGHVHDQRADLVRQADRLGHPASLAQLIARHAAVDRARLQLAGSGGGGVDVIGAPVGITVLAPEGGHDDIATLSPPSSTTVLTVRDGRTGRVRWTHRLAPTFSLQLAHLGPARVPALVVFQSTFTGSDSVDPTGLEGTGEQISTVVAYAVSTGRVMWTSAPVTGTYSFSPAGFTETDGWYVGDLLPGRHGDDILALDISDTSNYLTNVSVAKPIVLDGATGTQSATGGTVIGGDLANGWSAGDLNGDGVDDFYVAADGAAGSITADSGVDASQLWTQAEPESSYLYVLPTPDLDGDRRPDAVVMDFGNNGVTALAGRTGATLWTRQAVSAFLLGRLPHGEAVAIADFSGESAGIQVTALNGRGAVQWSRTLAPPDLGGGFGGAAVEFGLAGDVDADHVQDVFMSVAYATTDRAGTFTDILSGRTGGVRQGRSLGQPLFASLDGHGDDFLSAVSARGRWTATAYDGASRAKLWAETVGGVQQRAFGFPLGVGRLGARSHRSLLVEVFDGHATRLLALDAATGRPDWSTRT